MQGHHGQRLPVAGEELQISDIRLRHWGRSSSGQEHLDLSEGWYIEPEIFVFISVLQADADVTIYVVWDQLEVLEFSFRLCFKCDNTAGNILLRTPHRPLPTGHTVWWRLIGSEGEKARSSLVHKCTCFSRLLVIISVRSLTILTSWLLVVDSHKKCALCIQPPP